MQARIIDPIFLMQNQLQETLNNYQDGSNNFIPTGMMEPIIPAVGNAEQNKLTIILLQTANKCGKTAHAVNVLKNIFWENDKEYFDFPNYQNWPFPKTGRIIGTVENTGDLGPIRTEIVKWWDKNNYDADKGRKSYYSKYNTSTGHSFSVMTYDQQPIEFEGPLLAWQWLDEPPRAALMGAITSRYMYGGFLLLTMTPINAGIVLDIINDMEEKGTKVMRIYGNLRDNDVETGKLNSKGTKRGLMTKEQIDSYIASIPLDQRDARVEGKATIKSGKIYPMFDRSVHVKDFDLDSDYARQWNCYCVLDPHPKYYPFLQWWGFTPDELNICYNEWPNKQFLGSKYYDEVRLSSQCTMTPKEIARIIKILDCSQFGLKIMDRFIDPHVVKKMEYEKGQAVQSFLELYAAEGLTFNLSPMENIDVQRDKIRESLNYDISNPINQYNRPTTYIMPHCINTIRAHERHHYEAETEKEAEEYKDPIDCHRYYRAGKRKGWINNAEIKKLNTTIINNSSIEGIEINLG